MSKIESSSPANSPLTSGSTELQVIEPLTRIGYKRLPEVELQIAGANMLDPIKLAQRARQRDENDSDYLSAESLVYFIRRAVRRDDIETRDALILELFDRCKPHFRGKFRGFSREDREDMQGEVMKRIVEDLFAQDNRSEFMQVRFWKYLERKCIDACRNALRHTENIESLDTVSFDDDESEGTARLETVADIGFSPRTGLLSRKHLPNYLHIYGRFFYYVTIMNSKSVLTTLLT